MFVYVCTVDASLYFKNDFAHVVQGFSFILFSLASTAVVHTLTQDATYIHVCFVYMLRYFVGQTAS